MDRYTALWGRSWSRGPGILADIVVSLRGVGLRVTDANGRMTLDVPLPDVLHEGERTCIDVLVPPPLRPRLTECLQFAATQTWGMARQYDPIKTYITMSDGPATRMLIQAALNEHEVRARLSYAPTTQLWVARAFGFSDTELPLPAGRALPAITGVKA